MRRFAEVVLLDADEAAVIGAGLRLAVAWQLHRYGTALPSLVKARDDLAGFAARETSAARSCGVRETRNQPSVMVVAESGAQQMTAAQAAAVLGVSVQFARRLCACGELLATRSPAGHWRIDAASAAALAARRKESA